MVCSYTYWESSMRGWTGRLVWRETGFRIKAPCASPIIAEYSQIDLITLYKKFGYQHRVCVLYKDQSATQKYIYLLLSNKQIRKFLVRMIEHNVTLCVRYYSSADDFPKNCNG